VLGLTLFVTGYKQLLFSDWQHTYASQGVVHPDEPSAIYDNFELWLRAKMGAGEIGEAQLLKARAETMSRMKESFITVREHRGDAFIEQVPGGSRIYKLKNSSYQVRHENRYLMFAGVFLTFASLFGFIVEMRLRQLRRP
jgi:hypothetical protein